MTPSYEELGAEVKRTPVGGLPGSAEADVEETEPSMNNFYAQADIAEALDRISVHAAALPRNWLDEFRHCCSENSTDFYTEIAALILDADRCDA